MMVHLDSQNNKFAGLSALTPRGDPSKNGGFPSDKIMRRSSTVPCSERRKELKRRRHRRKKMDHFKKKLDEATVSEKAHIAQKIRQLSPGGEEIVDRLALEER
jgi:hypothetical protein